VNSLFGRIFCSQSFLNRCVVEPSKEAASARANFLLSRLKVALHSSTIDRLYVKSVNSLFGKIFCSQSFLNRCIVEPSKEAASARANFLLSRLNVALHRRPSTTLRSTSAARARATRWAALHPLPRRRLPVCVEAGAGVPVAEASPATSALALAAAAAALYSELAQPAADYNGAFAMRATGKSHPYSPSPQERRSYKKLPATSRTAHERPQGDRDED